jgi:mannose-6-phosphate isomerase-like protein (cupin superfamily)
MPQDRTATLLASLADNPETCLVPAKYLAGGSIGAQIAYGLESSMMIAVRQPHYHSRPHSHDAEQLNYVLDGELYVFVGNTGFLARKGDIFRIPRGATHWSWVQGTVACVLLETHTPPLIGDEGVSDTAVALLDADEARDGIVAVPSLWPEGVDQRRVEETVVPAALFAAQD